MKLSSSLLLLFSLSFIACESNPFGLVDNRPDYQSVDEELWIYFERFENEADRRGFKIDLNALGITGAIQSIPEPNVAGTCQYGQHLTHVTIDRTYWQNNSNNKRELIVFHELGHCALNLDHNDNAFSNGICKSIMHSGLTNCQTSYNLQNRDYYLNELFGLIQ